MDWQAPTGIPYAGDAEAVFRPAARDNFFLLHRPQSPEALCAEMSRLAYCAFGQTLPGALARVDFELVGFFDQGPVQGFLAQGPETAVLAFRGSDAPLDWMTNLNAAPGTWDGTGMVHRGFAAALAPVWPDIEEDLEQILQAPGRPLLITGHSLGAALATLTASLVPAARLITFGSPKVGDADFCATIRQAERYVNNLDVVCRLPLGNLPLVKVYRHVGRLHYIGPDGREQAPPDDLERLRFSFDRLRARLQARRPLERLPRDLADHAPINYVAALL